MPRSISIILAVGIGCELARGGAHSLAQADQSHANQGKFQIGQNRAPKSAKGVAQLHDNILHQSNCSSLRLIGINTITITTNTND